MAPHTATPARAGGPYAYVETDERIVFSAADPYWADVPLLERTTDRGRLTVVRGEVAAHILTRLNDRGANPHGLLPAPAGTFGLLLNPLVEQYALVADGDRPLDLRVAFVADPSEALANPGDARDYLRALRRHERLIKAAVAAGYTVLDFEWTKRTTTFGIAEPEPDFSTMSAQEQDAYTDALSARRRERQKRRLLPPEP